MVLHDTTDPKHPVDFTSVAQLLSTGYHTHDPRAKEQGQGPHLVSADHLERISRSAGRIGWRRHLQHRQANTRGPSAESVTITAGAFRRAIGPPGTGLSKGGDMGRQAERRVRTWEDEEAKNRPRRLRRRGLMGDGAIEEAWT
jgi:hypothetical protein